MGKSTARQAGLYIALAAMLFRAFMPDGWMPASRMAASGVAWPAFVICTSNGLVKAPDPAGEPHRDGDHGSRYTPCAYAAAHLSTPEVSASVVLYEAAFVSAPLTARAEALVAKAIFQPQRSRAPPFLTI